MAALFATVMAATLAGMGITLLVTQSWLRWVMVDAALIAFWRSSATATERGQQPADLRHPQR